MTMNDYLDGLQKIIKHFSLEFTEDTVKVWYKSLKDTENKNYQKAVDRICKNYPYLHQNINFTGLINKMILEISEEEGDHLEPFGRNPKLKANGENSHQ